MKRHEALAPLSREHHNSLILAQLLKKGAPAYKGLPESSEGKIAYALRQFDKEIKDHFKKEDRILDKAKEYNETLGRLAQEIKREHSELTALFLSLNRTPGPENMMDELGRALEKHIRKEERELFPLLEKHCPATLLQQIHNMLH